MTARRRVIVLTLVLATVALAVVGVALVTLYRTAVEGQRQRLVDTAVSHARIIESVAAFDREQSSDFPGGAWAATLSQLRSAHARAPGLGRTGEVLIGYREAGEIRYALPPRHAEPGGDVSVDPGSDRAEAMRRALDGEEGSLLGPDYRGVEVLAAFQPLAGVQAGLVVKMDLAEIRRPYVRAGVLSVGVALLLIVLGIAATYRIGGRLASEIVRLERLGRVADERIRLAVEGAGIGFWEVDFDEDRWDYSEELRTRLDYEPEEMPPTIAHWQTLLHPDDVSAAHRKKESLARGDSLRYESHYRLRAKDGSWRWIHSLGTLLDAEGRRAVGIHLDVTAEREMLETLQRSESRLSGIVRALPGSLVAILDDQHRYVYAAGEVLDQTGVPPEHVVGKEIGAVLGPEAAARSREHYQMVLDGATVEYELEFRGRTFLVRGTPIQTRGEEVQRALALATDITERKERERLLHDQRERLDRIVEGIPEALVVVLDQDLRFEYLGGELVSGREKVAATLLGTPVLDWVGPEDRDRVEAQLRSALAGNRVRFRDQFRAQMDDSGDPVPLDISAGPLRGPEGAVQGVLVLALDVSEQWEARKALEATRERLQLALEAGRHGTYDLDVASGIIEVDPYYASMLGFEPEGFTETLESWTARLHPDDREETLSRVDPFFDGTDPDYHTEFRLRTADGSYRWVRSVARAVARDEAGRATRIIGTHTDISQEKEGERTRELLSTAVARSSSLVVIAGPDGLVEYVNPEFERVTGYTAEEVVGRNTDFLRSEHHPDRFHREIEERVLRGESFETEVVNRKRDGSEYRQQTLVTPILGSDGTVTNVVTIGRDVTTERALEEQLRQAQKMEAVGQLTGGIAHDFNNVLTGILSNARLALDALPEEAGGIVEELTEVQKAAEHGAGLVRKLMAFSRDRHLDLVPQDATGFLDEIRGFLVRMLPETISLELEDRAREAVVELDGGAMHQILLNLATNARDAMPRGGRLTLGTSVDEDARRWVVEVSDEGEGIAPDLLSRVFEPFFTTKGDGTGLGLAMVYALTERQHGTVSVESEPGRGTTFRLSFPLSNRRPAAPQVDAPLDEPTRGTGTILVVEDEMAVRQAAQRILERAGYRVRLAEDGLEGLEILWQDGNEIDLVLSDVVMPGMGGPELYRAASAQDPHPPFLFTSGYADRDLEEELGGTSRFLRKPWDGRELLSMVQRVLREEGG